MSVILTEDERNAQFEYEHLFQVYHHKMRDHSVSYSELEAINKELGILYKRMNRHNKIDNILDS